MELRDYLTVIRARKWIIVQATVIVALAALIVSLLQPKVYEAEARVLIAESDAGAALFGTVLPEFSSQPERGMQTQVELMQLPPLAEQTVRELGLEMSPQSLLGKISVSSAGQTNILVVTARADEADTAAAIANSVATQYVDWSQRTNRESITSAADEVESRLDQARDEILELGRRIEADGRTDELDVELQIASGAYVTLAEKLEQLRINEQLERGSGLVVSPATSDPNPVEPTPARDVALGALIGLLLGVGLAFLLEYLDNTVKTTEEAERLLDAPVLGTIPEDPDAKEGSRVLRVWSSPGSFVAESYRVLRNSLDFINFEDDLKTLAVTSAAPSEGKSTVAANLAASLAQAGNKVVLVSCDFRRPTTSGYFDVNNVIGLSDVLLGTQTLKAALQRPGDESLLVLASGKLPPNPAELLGSEKMKVLLRELEDWADWVIMDTPPVLAVADPVAVARWADGVLIVLREGVSTREATDKANELLVKAGARVVGVVMWAIHERREGGYGSYRSGYYAGYYGLDVGGSAGSPAMGSAASSRVMVVPEFSPRKRAARALGRFVAVLLGIVLVVAIALAVVFFLDQYMGWTIMEPIFEVLGV